MQSRQGALTQRISGRVSEMLNLGGRFLVVSRLPRSESREIAREQPR